MKANEIMEKAENYVLHTYNRYPVVLDHGKGVRLYDVEGKEYLDFAAGIAVFALGYGNETYNQTLKDQIDRLIHTSNLYYNEPMADAAEKLVKAPQNTKLLISISDGQPKAVPDYAGELANNDMKQVIQEYSRKGILFLAAAIGQDKETICDIYGQERFLDITDLRQLPVRLVQIIARYL